MLSLRELYVSIQGESSHAGLPCVFVRLAGCDLRCSCCDSAYAFTGGRPVSVEEIVRQVNETGIGYATVTGGEPLLQPETPSLLKSLCDAGVETMLETSGAHAISGLDPRVIIVMDLKCPSSGECDRNLMENIALLQPQDEVKFVIATQEDFKWAAAEVRKRDLSARCQVHFSWAARPRDAELLKPFPPPDRHISMKDLADRIVLERLPVRFIPQLHKVIWGEDAESV